MIDLGFIKSPWALWLAGGAIAVGLAWAGVTIYGNARYDAGFAKAESAAAQRVSAAQQAAREASEALAALQAQRDQEAQQREEVRVVVVREVQEEIVNAETSEARYAAYLSGTDRVRQPARANLDRARADYLSSLAPAE